MTRKPVIAIFDATGDIGRSVLTALLQPLVCGHFQHIVALSRTTEKRSEWRRTDNIGIEIVVNAIGQVGAEFRRRLVMAMAGTSVRVYFPSEFDVDHYIHDFQFGEWDRKKDNTSLARDILPGVRTCQMFMGLILEKAFGPWLGFFSRHGRYVIVGSEDVALTCTSLGDIGRSVAQLAMLSPSSIPGQVHRSGTTKTIAQIARIMEQESGRHIRVVELSQPEYKACGLVSD